MMIQITFLDVFIIFMILVILCFYVKEHFYNEVAYVKSDVDGRKYLVKTLSDSQEASNRLARINNKLTEFIKKMKEKYPDHPDVKRLSDNYNPDHISEGLPEAGYTSYTINKGERIIVCMRQKDTNEFVDENVVLYPVLHELTHCAISDIGHTTKFWETFRWFLEEAVEMGIYRKVDYAKNPTPYCGIKLTTSVI